MTHAKPKFDPLAEQLVRLRRRLRETQGQFAKRFHVARTTMLNWERYGPPPSGPTREHAKAVIFRLKRQLGIRDDKKGSAAKQVDAR